MNLEVRFLGSSRRVARTDSAQQSNSFQHPQPCSDEDEGRPEGLLRLQAQLHAGSEPTEEHLRESAAASPTQIREYTKGHFRCA